MTAGPVFTEEMWRLACCALQDAFSATLEPVKVNCLFADSQNAIALVTVSLAFGRLVFLFQKRFWVQHHKIKHKDYVAAFIISSVHMESCWIHNRDCFSKSVQTTLVVNRPDLF